ncbi:hypothetical protein JHS3_15240 [Jeongeupia sp. HS-3]|uniref:YfjI family protein n=1 Tax=Jeongeupia sp. HS-3 TaxID=1009682 RepID=UPI0018A6763E|nr:YfjI family protein [Jeongeupia sp. HS-3]BCL75788.1 hypothetical protein JHS3_15240 [Jeongeupia sp. HS-3]
MNMNINFNTFSILGGDLPPALRDAINEVESNTKAPRALVVSAALSALSTVGQGLINVQVPTTHSLRPCSLWLITLAESGERKSTIDRLFAAAIIEFQQRHATLLAKAWNDYRVEHKIWKAEEAALLKQLTRLGIRHGNGGDDLRVQIKVHAAREPIAPKAPKLLYEDCTIEALQHQLFGAWPNAALASNEAAVIFKGHVSQHLPVLNKLWDGDDVDIDRMTRESFTVKDARLTLSLMSQPKPFQDFVQRNDGEARSLGFLARALVCQPFSTQGMRFIDRPVTSWEHLPKFQRQLAGLLEQSVSTDGEPLPERETMVMSEEASQCWILYYNRVEQQSGLGGCYANCKDHAAKLADNVARLAALLQLLDGGEIISLQNVERSIVLVGWYSNEFIRLFCPPPPIPQVDLDLNMLNDYLSRLRGQGCRYVAKNYVRKYGPNALRNKQRLDPVLDRMVQLGWITLWLDEKKSKYMDLWPLLIFDQGGWEKRLVR